ISWRKESLPSGDCETPLGFGNLNLDICSPGCARRLATLGCDVRRRWRRGLLRDLDGEWPWLRVGGSEEVLSTEYGEEALTVGCRMDVGSRDGLSDASCEPRLLATGDTLRKHWQDDSATRREL